MTDVWPLWMNFVLHVDTQLQYTCSMLPFVDRVAHYNIYRCMMAHGVLSLHYTNTNTAKEFVLITTLSSLLQNAFDSVLLDIVLFDFLLLPLIFLLFTP